MMGTRTRWWSYKAVKGALAVGLSLSMALGSVPAPALAEATGEITIAQEQAAKASELAQTAREAALGLAGETVADRVAAAYALLAGVPGAAQTEESAADVDAEALAALRGEASTTAGVARAFSLLAAEVGVKAVEVRGADGSAWTMVDASGAWRHYDPARAMASNDTAWLALDDAQMAQRVPDAVPWVLADGTGAPKAESAQLEEGQQPAEEQQTDKDVQPEEGQQPAEGQPAEQQPAVEQQATKDVQTEEGQQPAEQQADADEQQPAEQQATKDVQTEEGQQPAEQQADADEQQPAEQQAVKDVQSEEGQQPAENQSAEQQQAAKDAQLEEEVLEQERLQEAAELERAKESVAEAVADEKPQAEKIADAGKKAGVTAVGQKSDEPKTETLVQTLNAKSGLVLQSGATRTLNLNGQWDEFYPEGSGTSNACIYTFTISQTSRVELSFQNWWSNDAYWELYNADMSTQYWKTSVYSNYPGVLSDYCYLKAGTYKLKVYPRYSGSGYLLVKGTATAFTGYPTRDNDTFGKATSIARDQLVKSLFTRNDVGMAYYKFAVSSKRTVKISYQECDAKINTLYSLYLYNSRQERVDYWTGIGSGTVTKELDAGTYYVKLTRNESGQYASGGGPYTIQWTPGPIFPDVPEGHWAYSVVNRAADLGFISGYDNGRFGPNDPITRGQVASVLWNMAGKPNAGSGAKSFSDVKAGEYYYKAVRWASAKGVVSGYGNGKFGPNDKVTREQLAVMIGNYAKRVRGANVSGSLSDLYNMKDYYKVSDWAVSSVAWCFRQQILTGSDGNILPQGRATRAQAAKMVVVLYDILN